VLGTRGSLRCFVGVSMLNFEVVGADLLDPLAGAS
jgi:hypothetical protein